MLVLDQFEMQGLTEYHAIWNVKSNQNTRNLAVIIESFFSPSQMPLRTV